MRSRRYGARKTGGVSLGKFAAPAAAGRIVPLVKGLLTGRDTASTSVRTLMASMLVLGLNMLTGMLTANFLGPDGRGDHAAIILWPQFLAFVLTMGIHSAVLYNIKKYPDDAGSLYLSSLLLSCAAGVLAIFAGYYGIPVWLDDYSPDVVAFSQWSLAAAPLLLLTFVNSAVLRARDEFRLFNLTRYVVPLATLGGLAAFAAAGKLTPYVSAVAYLGPNLPVALWITVRLLRAYRPQIRGLWLSVKRNVQYGYRSYGIDLLGNMSLYVDQLIVVRLLPPSGMGLYVVAVSLARTANIFSTSLSHILFPKASGLPKDEVVAITVRVFRISTFVSLAAAAVAMAAAPFLLRLLYGSGFAEAVAVFRLLVLEVVVMGACIVLSQAFMSLGRPGVATAMYGAGLAAMIPLLYWLVPLYGITGAGLAMLLASFVRLLFILINYPLTLKAPFPKLFSFADDARWLKQALQRKGMRSG